MLNLILKQEQIKKQDFVVKSFIVKRFYTELGENKLVPMKIVGETKHFPPANKEWKNSIYAYNKSFLKSLPVRDNMARKLIRSYFYLSNSKNIARSRRMRSLIRKSTAKKIFVSRPEIKQTNDKVIITVHTFNREKQFLTRKIFFYNRHRRLLDFWRKKNSLDLNLNKTLRKLKTKRNLNNTTYIAKQSSVKRSSLNQTIKNRLNLFYKTKLKLRLYRKNHKNMFKLSLKRKLKRSFNPLIPYSGLKFKNEMNFLSFKILAKQKRFMVLRKLFYYLFMKYALSMFNVKIYTSLSILSKDKLNQKIDMFDLIKNKINLPTGVIGIYFFINKTYYFINLNLKTKLINSKKTNTLDKLDCILTNVNFALTQFLDSILIKSGIYFKEKKLYYLFNHFARKYYLLFISETLKKEVLLSSNYLKLMVNRFKFSKFLPGLKLLISKIYNKKTQMNIVNLKYPHLNTDIFTDSIALKLRKKVGLLRVIETALKLVKTPRLYLTKEEKSYNYDLNKIHNLDIYKSLKLKNLDWNLNSSRLQLKPDFLQQVLKRVYPRSLITNQLDNINKNLKPKQKVFTGKLINVLNAIKYKWVSGVRLEAAGRLTRRYTASRSVFKFKYKGSLKNTDYARKLDFLKKSMPVVKLRNQVKANSQYTFTKSKKRIGAFGIKGWISGY